MLSLENISVGYDATDVLHGVSITAQPSELTVILGANGSGKTTLFKTISGLLRTRSGTIEYNGHPIQRTRPNTIVKRGIAHCPEGGTCSGRCRLRRISAWARTRTGIAPAPRRSSMKSSSCFPF